MNLMWWVFYLRNKCIDIQCTEVYIISMPYFEWDAIKNLKLKQERGVSFEDVVVALGNNKLLETLEHPNSDKYPNQRIFVLDIRGYAYYVPYVEEKERIFFKTIFPNRKATKKYLSANN